MLFFVIMRQLSQKKNSYFLKSDLKPTKFKNMSFYLCIEGTEGMSKTTMCSMLHQHFKDSIVTSEPGSKHCDLTMQLRKLMLDAQYNHEMTPISRELISQAARHIHLERVIKPNIKAGKMIIQDRGVLSGLSYGAQCGNDISWLLQLKDKIVQDVKYDCIILLVGDCKIGLERAQKCKKEFTKGDVIEQKGADFMVEVQKKMLEFRKYFACKIIIVHVDDKNTTQIFNEILVSLQEFSFLK